MKKIIGVCLTTVQAELCREFLTGLYEQAKLHNYKIMVFNSIHDFNNPEAGMGAKAIYYMLPYEKLSAVIILHETIYDKNVINAIIQQSTERGVPVIFARGFDSRCYSLIGNFEKAYETLIQHVICDHQAKDIFFIAGRREGDYDSFHRLECLKKVLAENNVLFDDSQMDYGEYWEYPTIKVVNKLVEERAKLPDAIFCANDIMATAVCARLQELGYRVPEDVIVTGFDGMECAKCSQPHLSTCHEDMNELSRLIMEVLDKAIYENLPIGKYYYDYTPIISQSCGCDENEDEFMHAPENGLFKVIRENEGDEENSNQWLDKVLAGNNLETLWTMLPKYIVKGQYICIRHDDFKIGIEDIQNTFGELPDKLVVYSGDLGGQERAYDLSEGMPEFDAWMQDETMCFVSGIFVNNLICGLFYEKSSNISLDGSKINRHVRTVNKAVLTCVTGERQMYLKASIDKSKYMDALTELYNFAGVQKWYDEFGAVAENHDRMMAISVYSIINYNEILDKYGTESLETVIQFVAKSLTLANAVDTTIGRISADSFVVINYMNKDVERFQVIERSLNIFYGFIEWNNDNNQHGINVEVSCGCAEANPGWTGRLRDYINSATSELYLNRMSYYENNNGEPTREDALLIREQYNMFKTLIIKNMFQYHFQPIVDARTGEIVAYEALMRTCGDIKMSPLEVLKIGKIYRKLYDIEYATMFNVFDYYSQNKEAFRGRSVFINTIPGNFLNEEHCNELREKYGDCFGKAVFEITEQDTISNEELSAIKRLSCKDGQIRIAVDDYGTGHSNIVNLLVYKPQVVKIDRYLITNIQEDKNKQMFVKNLIDFAKDNDIKVLAEGVENVEELETVIDLGVDLIQGYYTARPSAEILQKLPKEIRQKIIAINMK